MTKQPIVKKMNVPVAVAWEAIRKLGKLDIWFPIIATCDIEGEGVGAVRRMTIVDNGGDIKDTIETIDDATMTLVYLRPESPFPVTYYKGTVEVFQSYDGLAVVAWTIDFISTPEDSASVAALVQGAISDGLDGMEKYLLTA